MNKNSTRVKSLIAGFSLGVISAGASLMVLDSSMHFLGSSFDQDNVKALNIDALENIENVSDLVGKSTPVSDEVKKSLISSIDGKDYGRVTGIYNTEIDNIKEVRSPEGVFYLSSDGKYAFFGDLVDVEKNISKTKISDSAFKAKLSIANAASEPFSRHKVGRLIDIDRVGPINNKSNIVSTSDGLNRSLPSRSEDAKALTPEYLKSLSQQLIQEKKSGALGKTSTSDSTSNIDDRLAKFREKWKERIEKKMAKKFDKVPSSQTPDSASLETQKTQQHKTRVDMSKLQSGGAFVTYKGKRKSKIGYNKKGEKISESETRNQVKEMYANLDKIGDKWSVVYPAVGEEKIGVMVFSDPTCPYCQKLHESIPTLNKAGVKVTILMYPRALALEKSKPEMASKVMASLHSAWCSATPAESLSKLYKGQSIPVQEDCSIAKEQGRVDFPAAYQYFLGKLFNLKGTPLSFTSDGYIVRGFSNSNQYLNDIGLTLDKRNKVRNEITISGLDSKVN